MDPAHFLSFARYNRWSNTRLFDAAASLDDADYRAPRPCFFGSIHNTLNHLLVGDQIWMRRFTGEGPSPDRLDAILHDALSDLTAARLREDERIVRYVDGLTAADLGSAISYRTIVNPDDRQDPLAPMLAHFFNHQTHHRGQVHALLSDTPVPPPSLDLLVYFREAGL